MSQWKSYASANGAPKWGSMVLQQGAGRANQAGNNTSLLINTTPGAWKTHGQILNTTEGMFPVTPQNKANTSGESAKIHSLGWTLRTNGLGPIGVVTVANGNFVNGETATVSGGSANARITLTTNATGNLASGKVTTIGLFPNTSVTIGANSAFNRELHVANLNMTNSTALTNLGNANVITVVIGNTNIGYGVLATGVFVSNATAAITNTQLQAIVWSGNTLPTANATGFWGLFGNTQTNTAITATFTSSNGAVIGGTYVVTANLTPSTGGNVQVTVANNLVAGRAGRVVYETMAVNRHIGRPVANVTITGATAAFTNTDFIVVSGGGQVNSSGQNARLAVSTNATGGLVNSGITVVYPGVYPTSAAVTATAFAANGAASNGTGATLVATLLTTVANTTWLPQ